MFAYKIGLRTLAVLAAIGVGCFAVAMPASAFMIIDTGGVSGGAPGGQPIFSVIDLVEGDAFNLAWSESTGNSSATGMLTVATLTPTQLLLGLMIENTSPDGTSRFTSFGVDVPGAISINSTTGGVFLTLGDRSNFPGFTNPLNCATSGANCSGGGGGGIPAGSMDNFSLNISGIFGTTVTLNEFAAKFQSVGSQGISLELAGGPTPKDGPPIPEPGTLLLIGSGLVGLGAGARRRKKQ